MNIEYLIGFRKDVRLEGNIFVTNYGTLDARAFLQLNERMRKGMLTAGHTEEELAGFVLEADGMEGLGRFDRVWKMMARAALVTYTLVADGIRKAVIAPVGIGFAFEPKRKPGNGPWQLSRFAITRTYKGTTFLECPKGWSQVDIFDIRFVNMLFHLQAPQTLDELADKCGLPLELAEAFLNMLAEAKALTAPGREGAGEEDLDPALSHWELHDLYFHTRSQMGRHNNGWATTYRFDGEFPPISQIKEAMSEDVVALPKRENPPSEPFFTVHERRRTRREFSEQPLNLDDLGTFLYHTMRVKQKFDDEKGGVTFRPSQSGGALHSLELYPLVNRCEGLESGLYHYRPLEHSLERLSPLTPSGKQMLMLGKKMMLDASEPQVELIVASRFARVQWKYQSLAYSVIMKDVGCLYQTMALVAEALGLAGVALGGGHIDLFGGLTRLNCLAEGSVGAYMLGRPAERAGQPPPHTPLR